MRLLLSALLLILGSLPVSAVENPPTVKSDSWRWACRADGYYVIEVAPDGTYKASADPNITNASIVITLYDKECPHQEKIYGLSPYTVTIAAPTLPHLDSELQLWGGGYATDSGERVAGCAQYTFPVFDGKDYHKIQSLKTTFTDEGGWLMLKPDDHDWRFELSSTLLMTERESRPLRIEHPNWPTKFDAEASAWIITGQCVLNLHP